MASSEELTMSLIPPPVAPVSVSSERLYRLTVDEYHRMIEAGILTEKHRVELLEGFLVKKPMTRHPPHDLALELMLEVLNPLLPSGWRLRCQSAVELLGSEPEPDYAVVRGHPRSRAGRHPGAADVGLIIEVADSSLDDDRGVKRVAYARAGIERYWIVNLVDRCLEEFTDPTGPADEPTYRQQRHFGPDEAVPVILDGVEIGQILVRDVLP
jgi:Uma2 family endonuclease